MADPSVKVVLKNLGRRIQVLRKGRSLTQESLAERSSISRTYMGSLEAGMKAPSLDVVVRVAKALEVDIAELFLDPAKAPASTRAIVARITSRLMDSGRSAGELARLEAVVGAFLAR